MQQSQDLFSDDDSPSGGATSQAAGSGSQSGRHGNRYDNETSQENLRYFCGIKMSHCFHKLVIYCCVNVFR